MAEIGQVEFFEAAAGGQQAQDHPPAIVLVIGMNQRFQIIAQGLAGAAKRGVGAGFQRQDGQQFRSAMDGD